MQTKPLSLPIYMDNNATTPMDPRVKAAMDPYFEDQFGNAASSSHAFGWQAQSAVRRAREQVATLLGCEPAHVTWTSGATESNNLAILGLTHALKNEHPHIITQATEHKAVLEVCVAARAWGAELTVLPVDAEGRVRLPDLQRAMTKRTVLCSIMMANNEIGTVQPLKEIASLCGEHGVILHTDAAQSVGKLEMDLRQLKVDMLSLSGHKIYGPKGVGALVVRPVNRDFELKPLMFGGDQEKKLRPGTLNVPAIVGLGEACALAQASLAEECTRLTELRDRLLNALMAKHPWIRLNGSLRDRLCNNLSLSFPGMKMEDMILDLSGIACSSGSACNSANGQPSHVLKALGVEDAVTSSTLRLGLGRFTTATEVQSVTDKLLKMLAKSRPELVHA